MNPQLSIRVLGHDDDLVGIEICANNEYFSGITKVYTNFDELSQLAKSLVGFPSNTNSVLFTFPSFGKSLFSVEFYVINNAGHTACQVIIESDGPTSCRAKEHQSVKLEIKFEAASLDRFQRFLANLQSGHNEMAVLVGIG